MIERIYEREKTQLEQGIEVELEHIPTINKIKKYLDENNELPDNETIAKWIAEDHLKEDKNYYTKLIKMENE